MTKSKKEDTVVKIENPPTSSGVTDNPNDIVMEMPDESEELEEVITSSLKQEVESSLDEMQKKLDALVQQNEKFLENPPKIAENKEKKKKGIKAKAAAFAKADDYTHFDLSVERRKLLTKDVIKETLQKDLDSLQSGVNSPKPAPDFHKKLEELRKDIEKFETFLHSSDTALDFEVRKSRGKLTPSEYSKSLIQGKEHLRSIAVRSLVQSVISAAVGSVTQVGAAYLKQLAFESMVSQLTEKEADQVVEDYLDELTAASEPQITTTSESQITTASESQTISDEALENVTNVISTSEAAKFSEDLCESLLDHIESLKELPDTVEELKQVANNFLEGEIERLGNERSFSHNFIKTMQDCVDFSSEIEGVVKPDSPYYDASTLDYGTIVGGDFAIGLLKGSVLPFFDSLYEKGKENRTSNKIGSQKKDIGKFKKFREETAKSMKNQAKGVAATLALVFIIKGFAGQLNFDGIGKDLTFNALATLTNGSIDGVRSLSSCGDTCSQITKASLRTMVGRGIPQIAKSGMSRGKEFGPTGIAVMTDFAGVVIGGAIKEINGAIWQRSANSPDGWLNSWAGKTRFHEKKLFKALKKRKGDNSTVKKFFGELGKVDKRVTESDTYLNQIDASLTGVTVAPPVPGGIQMSSDSGVGSSGDILTTDIDRGATSGTDLEGAVSAVTYSTDIDAPRVELIPEQRILDTEITQIDKSLKKPDLTAENKKSLKRKKKNLQSKRSEIRQQREQALSSTATSDTNKTPRQHAADSRMGSSSAVITKTGETAKTKITVTAEIHPTKKPEELLDHSKFKTPSIKSKSDTKQKSPKPSPKSSPKLRTTKL